MGGFLQAIVVSEFQQWEVNGVKGLDCSDAIMGNATAWSEVCCAGCFLLVYMGRFFKERKLFYRRWLAALRRTGCWSSSFLG
jgi:hypothetical protein